MGLSRNSIILLLVLWVAAMALSGWSLLQDPSGDGFTRGLNRIMGFLSWQLAAAILSLGLWFGVRPVPKGTTLRWLGRIPGWWSVLLLVGIVGLVLYSFIAVRQDPRIPPADVQPLPEATVPVE